jgi:FkbM family methyltransferase
VPSSVRRIGGRVFHALAERLLEYPPVVRMLERKYVPFDMIFADIWQEYLLDHYAEVSAKLDILCEGMDAVSREIAQTVAERYFYVAPRCRFNDVVLYRQDCLFTEYERDLQAKYKEVMGLREKQGFWLPSAHRGLSISVFAQHNGIDFIPDARHRIRGASVIDGGAFIGDSALVMNELGPSSIYCFEPDTSNCQDLEETIFHNRLGNVTIINAGLAAHKGTSTISGHASETKLIAGNGTTQVTTIDSFCNELDITPALIKLDVEGLEYDVIEGALETIQRSRPLLIISVYHNPRDFFEIKPRLQRFALDYEFMIRRLDPFHPTNETVLICY